MVRPNVRREPTSTGALGREGVCSGERMDSFRGLLAPLILLLLHPVISVLGLHASWGTWASDFIPRFIAAAC